MCYGTIWGLVFCTRHVIERRLLIGRSLPCNLSTSASWNKRRGGDIREERWRLSCGEMEFGGTKWRLGKKLYLETCPAIVRNVIRTMGLLNETDGCSQRPLRNNKIYITRQLMLHD